MRRAARVDANQPEIVQALRRAGATVQPLHMVGQGCPDIAVGKGKVNLFMEIKDERQAPCKRRLTPDEERWHREWRGQVAVVESVEDALRVLESATAVKAREDFGLG